jgi:predicted metal-dependent hydrolase
MDRRLVEFIRLFNTKKFFKAHEVLEELWIESDGDEKDFYKGLIQCAAAFVHLERSNSRGAHKLLTRAMSHLQNFPSQFGSIDLDRLMKEVNIFFSTALNDEQHGATIKFELLETPRIHKAE